MTAPLAFTAQDLVSAARSNIREIDSALSTITIQGDRYPPALSQMTGR